MQAIEIRFVFLFLFLCNERVYCISLQNCGEFNKAVKEDDATVLPWEEELNELFDAFDENDNERFGEVLKYLANQTIDDPDDGSDESYATDIDRYVPDRIKSNGYPAEVHQVDTPDGYKLQAFRIPFSKKSPKSIRPKPPIFLMHGFLDSASSWIALGPDHSLAYMLADAGYDVWLGNARGTAPSRKHKSLKPKGLRQKKFWQFSWHEIGMYDVPAFIDYVLDATNYTKLNYIGFSQGTTSFFVMTSMRPEYNDKILEANLLAPVALLKGNENVMYNAIARFYDPLKKALEILRVYKLTISNQLLMKVSEIACRKASRTTPLSCKLILAILSSSQVNCSSLPYILVNTPAGASLNQGVHYIQLIRSGGFVQFDYDDVRINRKKYGRDTPPPYDLSKITTPVNLIYSENDDTAVPDNVKYLQSKLPNVKSTHVVPIDKFSHVDFTYSRFVRMALNERLIDTINKVNKIF